MKNSGKNFLTWAIIFAVVMVGYAVFAKSILRPLTKSL
jgi:hypothetical protein